jgi:1,3-beta-glucan synthase component
MWLIFNMICWCRVRMHYGHPDVFDRIFHITRGGISKASRVINISEDIFAGYLISLTLSFTSIFVLEACSKSYKVLNFYICHMLYCRMLSCVPFQKKIPLCLYQTSTYMVIPSPFWISEKNHFFDY